MSKVDRMIELKPLSHGDTRETLVSVGHRCEYCQGNGYFWGVDELGKNVKKPCPYARGSKNLMPSSTSHGNQPVKISCL